MNYYKQGNAANADKIRAAFEKFGYDISWPGGCASPDVINIGVERNGAKYVVAETSEYIKCIIKNHPDYKELELPVEPKFKVGDWVAYNENKSGVTPMQIIRITEDRYIISGNWSYDFKTLEADWHLWTIEDAKDGDVLATDNGWTCIFKAFDGCVFSSYCFMDSEKWFCEFGSEAHTPDSRLNGNIHPATKEQRDLLLAKLLEAGCELDADKKELKKIPSHYDIANFKPFDKVLVRCKDGWNWECNLFSRYDHRLQNPFITCNSSYPQCIPFEGNEHLLGTTDMCDEMYINW